MKKRIALTICCLLAVMPEIAHAQALRVGLTPHPTITNPRIPNSMQGIISHKATQRGLPANSNTTTQVQIATEASISYMQAGVAAVPMGIGAIIAGSVITAAGIASAPAWLTAGAVMLAGIGISGAIIWAANGGYDWIIGNNPTPDPATGEIMVVADAEGITPIPESGEAMANFNASSALPQQYRCAGGDNLAVASCHAEKLIEHGEALSINEIVTRTGGYDIHYTGEVWGSPGQTFEGTESWATYNSQQEPCNGYISIADGQCIGVQDHEALEQSLGAAQTTVPDEIRTQPLSPDTLARLIDEAWKGAASQPGYAGLPYDPANPVTVDDVVEWWTANPNLYPTVGDALAPTQNPANGWPGTNPWTNPQPEPQPSPYPNPNPGEQPNPNPNPDPTPEPGLTPENVPGTAQNPAEINWGELGTPTMDATPSMQDILNPLLGLFPDVRNWQATVGKGECPAPEMTIFEEIWDGGIDLNFEEFCSTLEDIRTPIAAVMLAVFGIVSLRIFLEA